MPNKQFILRNHATSQHICATNELLSAQEKSAFRSQHSVILTENVTGANTTEGNTGLGLRWQIGSSWYSGGGLHGDSGDSLPFNSIDFHNMNGSGHVLAPQDGIIYKSCRSNRSALIKLVHQNGYTTSYYHMTDLTNIEDGTMIKTGTYLGRTGNELPCGGHSTGAHVHFSLNKAGQAISLNKKIFGGWTFTKGVSAYSGYAERNGNTIKLPGGPLINDGPSSTAATTGVVRSESANVRSSPKLSDNIVERLPYNTIVEITCYVRGESYVGIWGTTDIWYRMKSGWISDGVIYTGSDSPVTQKCEPSNN